MDAGNRCIRMVSIERTGEVWTMAGQPDIDDGSNDDGAPDTATFAIPTAIALNVAGNAFITDGNFLRKLTPSGQSNPRTGLLLSAETIIHSLQLSSVFLHRRCSNCGG